MPFVTDIAGPQRPVQAWPPLVAGALRRTSTVDTHPAGAGNSDVDLRARDVVGRAQGAVDVLGQVGMRAHLIDRVIDDIASDPPDVRLAQLVGARVGPGFRSTVGKLFPDEVRRASLLHLLLDDWVGAALVSGYAVQHAAINLGIEEKLPAGTADHMAGICAGFAEDASLVPYAKRNGTIPSVHGPVAPPLDAEGMHDVEELGPHGMRRFRRLDLGPGDDFERALPRLARRWRRCRDDRARVHGHRLRRPERREPSPRSPRTWLCCHGRNAQAPSEAPHASRGMTLSELRARIRNEFVGTSTCTHLNDTLRAVADLDALLELRAGV